MKYAEVAAYRFGVDVTYLPPDYQSLSQCETAIHRIGDEARAVLSQSCLPATDMIYAWKYAIAMDNMRCLNPDKPPPLFQWDEDMPLINGKLLFPFGAICAVRKTRNKKHQDVEQVGKTLRLATNGSLIEIDNDDTTQRGDSMIFVGYPSDRNIKDKWFLTINNNDTRSLINSRSVKLLQPPPVPLSTLFDRIKKQQITKLSLFLRKPSGLGANKW